MGEIKKRGGTYWIRYYRLGRRFEESARTDDWREAKRILALRESGDISEIPRETIERKQRLYVIRNLLENTLKIGRSHDPEFRIRQLHQNAAHLGLSISLELVGSVPMKSPDVERLIHGALSHARTKGEWFIASDDAVKEFVDSVVVSRSVSVSEWLDLWRSEGIA